MVLEEPESSLSAYCARDLGLGWSSELSPGRSGPVSQLARRRCLGCQRCRLAVPSPPDDQRISVPTDAKRIDATRERPVNRVSFHFDGLRASQRGAEGASPLGARQDADASSIGALRSPTAQLTAAGEQPANAADARRRRA